MIGVFQDKERVMDVRSRDVRPRLGSVQFFILVVLLLPFGSANAIGSIGRSVSSFCAPATTSPDVGSCSACHTSGNPSLNDLNAAGMQSQSGNFAFFCPAPTPAPAPGTGMGTGTGSGTGTGAGAMGSGMTGMSGRSGMSGMRGSGSRSRSGDDDDVDDDDGRDDD